jgi:hypothetical protein
LLPKLLLPGAAHGRRTYFSTLRNSTSPQRKHSKVCLQSFRGVVAIMLIPHFGQVGLEDWA